MSLFSRINNPRASNSNNNAGNRPVCRFFLEGRCRFGDNCRDYHPPRDSNSTNSRNTQQLPYSLSIEAIKADLTTGEDRPSWPLSSYGPGKDAPRQLLEGPLEQSAEELRVQYYLAQNAGSTAQYEQSESDALNQANAQAQRILSDLDGAVKYVIDAKDIHPNREDLVQKSAGNFPWKERPSLNPTSGSSSSGAFGQPSTFGGGAGNSAFGQPSGQPTSTFGQPSAFGAKSAFTNQPQTGASAFGQPSNLASQTSAFGSKPSAFGAPSALGSGGSAFGKPSSLGTSAFGQTSAMGGTIPFGGGQSAQGSAFGQSSALGSGGSTFGKTSAFGAAATPAAPTFGQSSFGTNASQPATGTSTFGQPSAPAQQQAPFGQAANAIPQGSTFGQSSTFGSQQSTFGNPSPFASSAATGGSAFGQVSQPHARPAFGAASPFGASTTTPSAFGKPSQPAPQAQATPFGSAAPSTNAFGSTQAANANATPSPFAQAASITSQQTFTPGQASQPLTSFRNRRIFTENTHSFYTNPQTNKKERVWFPDGPPAASANAEAARPEVYEDATLGVVLKQVYEHVKEHGVFKNGVVPEIPPKREWVTWEL